MTIDEFVTKHRDLLLLPVHPDELGTLTETDVLFLLTAARGRKPIGERKLLTASWAYPVWFSPDGGIVNVIRITEYQNMKIDSISRDTLEGDKMHQVLYRTARLSPTDRRHGKLWKEWIR